MTILIYILIGVVGILAGALISIVMRQRKSGIDENVISKLSSDALRQNNEQFLTLAKQVLGSEKTEMRADLEGKKSAITSLVDEIRRDLRRNEERLSQSDQDRVRSFSALKNELETYKQITGELKGSTDHLKRLLANNQLRGQFGEQVAEDLLKMAGFVIGQDYQVNKSQDTTSTRPDFTIFLPDGTKINIDVKFPFSSLVKYVETENALEKKQYLEGFKREVKEKIKQVCSREYINPQEHTVDFVVLFIPNEMIFSFIYDKMNEIWEDAMRKKVVLAGPFSFTAILRMIKQAHTNFQYQKNMHNIIGLIHKFDEEYHKYSEEVDKLGTRIDSVSQQYHAVSTTRDRKLTSVVDKIKSQKAIEENPEPLKLDE